MTMTPTHALLAALLLAPLGALPAPLPAQEPEANASRIPTFAGPTPDTLREITIPTVDLSGDEHRQVVVARGTDTIYHGHCDTVLMADGKTMFAAWCVNHAGHLGPLARSDDRGLTWSEPLPTPADWQEVRNTTPVIHRLTDPHGVERLFVFGGCDFPGNIRCSFSEDGGKTWSPMTETGLVGEVAPKSILPFDGGKRLIMWSDRRDPNNAKDPHPVVWQSESLDGGLTWSKERVILVVPGQWAQPSVTRSADGRQLLMLMRENTRKYHSLYSVSEDDARTWSEPKELPASLTGDRHVIKHVPDGRLVIAFRDMAKTSNTYGHYVAWVGTFEDVVNRREGQYRIKLLHNAARSPKDTPGTGNTDCGYSDLELLADGTIIATTYIKYATGPEKNSVVSTRFKLSETDALAAPRKRQSGPTSLLPASWDPALAGDVVMSRLIKVTAPQVKGAHDAEFACVGDRAYIVAEVNDLKGGESAAWPFIYTAMSIVNLGTLKLENVIDFAKSEQAFENETLPVGACFVPRIIQKDAGTLRCFFTSEDPGKRQSQMWYRDFDLHRGAFAPTIHKAKLTTAGGTFDFQPRYFHADAAAKGFTKNASDHSFFIFDSFKRFDGRLYAALNNFSGKQNALALVHDDLATFEVLGHFNEPLSEQLSEAAVNRLPDGTWIAICRNDQGNYHFTISTDGKTWSAGKEMPHVPNGANSKPTFDKFGGVYYLGWQESTRIRGVSRSVFNVDISRDGRRWERKYRFETPKSFQYPTFHEHAGVIWLCVTQGDSDPSRKERIMFGKLEDVGQFEPQEGRKRIAWPAPPPDEPAVMKRGVKLFTDRQYVIDEMPDAVRDLPFHRTSIEKTDVTVTMPGTLLALTPTIRPNAASQEDALQKAGFTKVDVPEVQLFPGEINRVSLYRKTVEPGERLRFRKMVLLVLADGVAVREHNPLAPAVILKPEKLYNGIQLPDVWPPRFRDPASDAPMPVPYLAHPPKVIPIDVGRQLFVDDFLIESTDLKRVFHQAEKFEGNPVFRAETAVEKDRNEAVYLGQGGVFYDPSEKLFKMFYTAGWRGPLAMATSPDLKTWTRLELGLHEGNILRPEGAAWGTGEGLTAGTDDALWYDITAANPRERIKYVTCWMHAGRIPGGLTHSLQVSDGVTWSKPVPCTVPAGDYGSIFYNPFRNKWVQSIKQDGPRGRCRYYVESQRFLDGADWSKAVYWTNADRLDRSEPAGAYPGFADEGDPPQLYSLAAVAYESLMIGMHQIHRGPKNEICAKGKFPKLTDLELGFSRDGFHWDRPDRRGLLRGERRTGAWDRAYLHTTTGVFVVLDDQLVFPYCAFSGDAGQGRSDMYGGGAIGLASLRRDGFASMEGTGLLTTRPVKFKGRHLFVNVNGDLRVETLDEAGKAVRSSKVVSGDHTKLKIEWADGADLSDQAGWNVKFRFHLTKGSLYAFWVTPDENGASNGYLGAGGPAFNGVRDVAASAEK